jgi:hypothetical protein
MNVPCDLAQFRSLGLSAERMPGAFNLRNAGADALRRDITLSLRRLGDSPIEAWAAYAGDNAHHQGNTYHCNDEALHGTPPNGNLAGIIALYTRESRGAGLYACRNALSSKLQTKLQTNRLQRAAIGCHNGRV